MKKIILITFLAINAIAYTITTASTQNISSDKTYSGNIYAKQQIMVATRLMGYIKKMNVEAGDKVHKGELLFEVDPSDIYSMINQAKAGVMQAQSGLLMAKLAYADAKKDYQRFKNLYAKGAVSKRDFQKMQLNMNIRKSQIDLAEGMLDQAKAGLQRALDQKKYAKVTSPINGVVIRKTAKVAEMAIPGYPVLVLANLSSLRAKAFVKEGDIKKLHKNQKVSVYVSAINKTIPAIISAIIPSADPATHSYLVKFKLLNTKGLLPGMYAQISIQSSDHKDVVVPFDALTSRGGIVGIFTIKDNKAKFIPVQIIAQKNGKVAVTNIKNGEKIVLLPPANMNDGTPIKE